MKITIVLGAFFPVPPLLGGAVEKVWFVLGKEFVRQGHEVVQISRTHPKLPLHEMIGGVRHLRVRGHPQPRSIVWLKWLDLLYSLRVRRILPVADILVTNTFWLPFFVRRKAQGLLYVHVQRGPKGQMRYYGHAARLCAVSNAIAERILAEAPALREKVRVIPNAVPFQIDKTDAATRDKVILFVGRIHPEKGIELFLRGVALLPKQVLGLWRIKIVGPHEVALGGGGDSFLRRMQRLGAESGAEVEWRGQIFNSEALADEYRSSLVFAYPSIADSGEALPLAPLEAMAHGSVPFVSDLACFRDYIVDGVTGAIFDHRAENPEKRLANRLANLLQLGSVALGTLGTAARAKAAEFDATRVSQRYLEDFAELLKNRP
jgi:glycosyltransferase involved in cell wall biosynthesis